MDTQIANLRTKQDDYANLTGDAFETIKNEIRKQINELSEQIRLKPIIKARLKAIAKMEKKLNDEKEKAYDGLSNM